MNANVAVGANNGDGKAALAGGHERQNFFRLVLVANIKIGAHQRQWLSWLALISANGSHRWRLLAPTTANGACSLAPLALLMLAPTTKIAPIVLTAVSTNS